MSIRYSGGPRITADDLNWMWKGRSFGVELTELGGFGRFISVVEIYQDGTPQFLGKALTDCEDKHIIAAGGPANWINFTFFPWLQEVMSNLFPDAGEESTVVRTLFEQVDALLQQRIQVINTVGGGVTVVLRDQAPQVQDAGSA